MNPFMSRSAPTGSARTALNILSGKGNQGVQTEFITGEWSEFLLLF